MSISYGGRILFYRLKINNGKEFSETRPEFTHVFSSAGINLIEYYVVDSDGVSSNKENLTVDIK